MRRVKKNVSVVALVGFGFFAGVISKNAFAANPLDFYVGGAVGQSHIREDEAVPAPSGSLQFDEQHTAWKGFIGLRPIKRIGAEFEYIDFGRPSASYAASTIAFENIHATVSAKAKSVTGLLYLPVPAPQVDIFGKLGLARVQSDVQATISTTLLGVGACPINNPNCATVTSTLQQSRTENRFEYGIGAQLTVSHIAFRAAYERVNASAGNLDLASLGVVWKF